MHPGSATLVARSIDVCEEYTVALALEDFVPVMLAGVALMITAQATGRRVPRVFPIALIGAIVVTTGGLAKATWKILVASGCHEYPILEQLLFPCLAFGFSALVWALLSAKRGSELTGWPFAVFPVAAAIGALWMGHMWPLLIAAAVSATALGVTAAVIAFKAGRRVIGALFVVYVLGTNILPSLAARPEQSVQIQWAEQLTNTAVQLCFLLGALWLRKYFPTTADRESVYETTGETA
ncbi:hypothetical protein [Aeromicrobium wangtongii]|uniref:Uncharacterized protein n=1 Tax=Aeromicrobium wangtongii TaxID=2969247 RepID=A0ABY5M786_9ACTN|nr:hypothetical protein [Aeromicrobium wangtongii]MCD9198616.1 hypothetical protein [Aeromicrobium wangtongii]UUP12642.1 hypothetical protein NQV15_12335 [Aeromicrobium wangtongii]